MSSKRNGGRKLTMKEEDEQHGQEEEEEGRNGQQEEEEEEGTHSQEEEEEDRSDSDEIKMQPFLSDEANKVVRDKYQKLMNVIHEHTDENKTMDAQKLQMMLVEADEIFDSVRRPREAAMDAQLLKACANMAKHNIESSQSNLSEFNLKEYSEKLISFATEEEEEEDSDDSDNNNEDLTLMSKICKKACHLFNPVHGIQPLYSGMDWERPERRHGNRQARKEEVIVTKAKQVAVLTDPDAEEEAQAVSWIYKILKQRYNSAGNSPLPFFNFIINPDSFSRTVENLFHVSLLVREQYAQIIEDEDGMPVILPTQSAGAAMEGEAKQCIMSMDMDDWTDLIQAFKISDTMIPPMNSSTRKRK